MAGVSCEGEHDTHRTPAQRLGLVEAVGGLEQLGQVVEVEGDGGARDWGTESSVRRGYSGICSAHPSVSGRGLAGLTIYDGVPPRTPVTTVVAPVSIQAIPAFTAKELVFTSAAEQLVVAILAHESVFT